MKKTSSLVLIFVFMVGCSSTSSINTNTPTASTTKEQLKPTPSKKVIQNKKVVGQKENIKPLYPSSNSTKSLTSSSASSKYTAKRIYTCSELNKSNAYSLLKSGHSCLDRDGDGHPCEWGKKKIKTYAPSYKSNCHYVGGYYRKGGTYVRGHMRCR